MAGPINWTELPGLHRTVIAAGHTHWCHDGVHYADDPVAVQAIIDSYNPLAFVKSQRLAALAEKRYAVEQGGFNFQGALLKTDDRSKMMMSAANSRATATPTFAVNWKVGDGVFVKLTAVQVKAAFAAVADFVNACFDHERELTLLINAATTLEEVAAIDITAGWPQ